MEKTSEQIERDLRAFEREARIVDVLRSDDTDIWEVFANERKLIGYKLGYGREALLIFAEVELTAGQLSAWSALNVRLQAAYAKQFPDPHRYIGFG